MKKTYQYWILSIVSLILVLICIIFVSRYVIRSNTEVPLKQLATDTAWKTSLQIEKNGKIEPLAGEKVDIGSSQETFVIVYNKNKEVLDSTALLYGVVPRLPEGVLDSTLLGVKKILTWEPSVGVRIAAVVVSSGDYGYVVVGRSLAETEQNITQLNKTVLILFGLSIIAVTIGFYIFNKTK